MRLTITLNEEQRDLMAEALLTKIRTNGVAMTEITNKAATEALEQENRDLLYIITILTNQQS